tara:strand:- start:909 stop:1022 length:114 start_codon:yes stop_codon:yes gene_type:complete
MEYGPKDFVFSTIQLSKNIPEVRSQRREDRIISAFVI